ncbi:MAG: cob(I)yrinic acid a,c-diamide adenosyltransferase [Actinomycetia bacterium]|nr:cob(I)yrinic acid a,c-diamide adenosyltransferase [Actinomycetes bacterium]
MAKIYTRTGDQGLTSITHGRRVPKDDVRVEAYGALDEANAVLGWLRARLEAAGDPAVGWFAEAARAVERVQNDLFNVGFDWVWNQGEPSITAAHVEQLERDIDAWYAAIPAVDDFVLPGGSEIAALAHVARTTVRRAERRGVRLNREAALNPESLRYVNRLSDWLFALARRANVEVGRAETIVTRHARRKPPNRRF